jgi:hypothetical protein
VFDEYFVFLIQEEPQTVLRNKQMVSEFTQWLLDVLPEITSIKQTLEGSHAVILLCTKEQAFFIGANAPHVEKVSPGSPWL